METEGRWLSERLSAAFFSLENENNGREHERKGKGEITRPNWPKKGIVGGCGHYLSLNPLSHSLRRKSCGRYV